MMCDMENKYEWVNEWMNEWMNEVFTTTTNYLKQKWKKTKLSKMNKWGRSTRTSRVDYKYKEVENILLVFSLTLLFRRRPKCTDICMPSVVLKWNLNKNHSFFLLALIRQSVNANV